MDCGVLAHGLTANDDRTCSSTRLYLCSFVDQSPLCFAELQQRVCAAALRRLRQEPGRGLLLHSSAISNLVDDIGRSFGPDRARSRVRLILPCEPSPFGTASFGSLWSFDLFRRLFLRGLLFVGSDNGSDTFFLFSRDSRATQKRTEIFIHYVSFPPCEVMTIRVVRA